MKKIKKINKNDCLIVCNKKCVQIFEHNDFLIKGSNIEDIIIFDNVNAVYLSWNEFLTLNENSKYGVETEMVSRNNLRRLKWKVYKPFDSIPQKGRREKCSIEMD